MDALREEIAAEREGGGRRAGDGEGGGGCNGEGRQ